MNNWSDKFALIIITMWVGALWTTGVVAYVLFNSLPDSQLAGQLAGKFFNYVSYLGLFSAFYLLIHRLFSYGTLALKQSYFWAVLVMLLLVLAGHFGIQPILAQLKIEAMPGDECKVYLPIDLKLGMVLQVLLTWCNAYLVS
jgi:hypothetical protein